MKSMQRIITERLELKRFSKINTEQYISLITDPNVTKYLGSGSGITQERAVEMISAFESTFGKGYGVFAVVERASGDVIGHCGIRPIPDGRIEILYAYAPSAWGKGYATEAGLAVLKFGKEHFNLTELIAMSYPQNLGSIGVIKKLGFEHIGAEEHFGKTLELFVMRVRAHHE